MTVRTKAFDEAAALKALDGNQKLLAELAQIFLEDAPNLIQELESGLAQNQLDQARRAVHSLKGLTATFFARQTTELAQRLEEDISHGNIESLLDGGADELKRMVDQLSDDLRASSLCAVPSRT